MDLFDLSGHLTDAALDALVRGDVLPELSRLEAGEHLAFCDVCLLRYTARLTDDVLLQPPVSCRESLWRRIRMRSLRLLTSRYATAAAGVALMAAVLWGGAGLGGTLPPKRQEHLPAISQQFQSWPQRWSDSLGGAFSHLSGFFEQFDGGGTPPQGGTIS